MSDSQQTPDDEGPGTAIVLHPTLPGSFARHDRDPEDALEEAVGLIHAIFMDVCESRVVPVRKIDAGALFGKGTREMIAAQVEVMKPDVVFVNHALSPVQQRNLEQEWKVKVIDRTGLILEIFGSRAQTREGKIQVQLAALEYQKSRLVKSWSHLERQRGGMGKTGGPGETQLEIDRRLVTDRITQLKRDLEQISRTRDLQRKGREKVPFPVVSLVGYTNAGKSTLFNRLTGANVFAEDLPFATLDPTMRRVKLEDGNEIILADTVGFIADLPTHLVASFRATLEQVQYADVIIHVRDMSRHDRAAQKNDVVSILHDLGIEYASDRRVVEVLNKMDAIAEENRPGILREAREHVENTVAISALTGEGIDDLMQMISRMLAHGRNIVTYHLHPAEGEALAWLYARCNIIERIDGEDAMIAMRVEIDPADQGRFAERFGKHAA